MDLFGARYRIKKIAGTNSQVRDLAIFFLWDRDVRSSTILAKVKANCFPVSESMPQIGDSAHRIGYPWNNKGNWRRVDGRFIATRAVGVKYDFSKSAISGESGAPYFNTNKEVVAINWSGGETSMLTSLDQIRSFLQKSIGGIPNCNKAAKTSPTKPKPKVQPVNPSPGIDGLLRRIAALEKALEKLRNDFNQLSKQEGPKGDTGRKGPQGLVGISGKNGSIGETGPTGSKGDSGSEGPPGTITIILIGEDGNEIKRQDGVLSGSVVRLNKKKFLKEE